MNGIPPGWYQNSNGDLQWWDGSAWGPVAPETTIHQQQRDAHEHLQVAPTTEDDVLSLPAPTKKFKIRPGILWTVGTVAVFAVMLAAVFGLSEMDTSASDPELGAAVGESEDPQSGTEPEPKEAVKPTPVTPQKSPEQIRDAQLEREGYQIWRSGETYVRTLTESEAAEAWCGYFACLDYVIYSWSGCSGGFYVRADILSGGTPVGWTNEISASAHPNEVVVVRLEDYQGIGDAFRLTEVDCMPWVQPWTRFELSDRQRGLAPRYNVAQGAPVLLRPTWSCLFFPDRPVSGWAWVLLVYDHGRASQQTQQAYGAARQECITTRRPGSVATYWQHF